MYEYNHDLLIDKLDEQWNQDYTVGSRAFKSIQNIVTKDEDATADFRREHKNFHKINDSRALDESTEPSTLLDSLRSSKARPSTEDSNISSAKSSTASTPGHEH